MTLPAALLLLCAFTSPPEYSSTLATQLLHYAEAAYCPDSTVQSWSCAPCREEPGLNVSLVVSAPSRDTHGFIGWDARGDGAVVVAFRGTDPLKIASWLVDLESAVLVPYAHCDGCKVGDGFLSAFTAIANRTVGAVLALAAEHPRAPIVLTGHSLGSAYVALLAMELWSVAPSLSLTLATFGQPRVGNAAFANAYAARLASQAGAWSWRLTHFADPVPHLPLEAMGFAHVQTEVHYGELNEKYTVCDGSGEDPHWADGVLVPLLLTDHWTYLGVNFLEEFVACKL